MAKSKSQARREKIQGNIGDVKPKNPPTDIIKVKIENFVTLLAKILEKQEEFEDGKNIRVFFELENRYIVFSLVK
jgi:hypothetical protein